MASEIEIRKAQNKNDGLRKLKGPIRTVQTPTAAEIGCGSAPESGCVNQKSATTAAV
jgi:hypothetical protein